MPIEAQAFIGVMFMLAAYIFAFMFWFVNRSGHYFEDVTSDEQGT